MVGTHRRALPLFAGPSNDPLPAKSEAGVRPARPRGVLRPQHRHLPLRHPHREDVQGPPGEDGRQNQVLEETLVRFWPSQAELLLLRGWGRAALTACLSVCLNSSSSNKQHETGFFFKARELNVLCLHQQPCTGSTHPLFFGFTDAYWRTLIWVGKYELDKRLSSWFIQSLPNSSGLHAPCFWVEAWLLSQALCYVEPNRN